MKFYIGVTVVEIPDDKYANEIVSCGDNHFKEEIKISDGALQYSVREGKKDLFLESLEEVIECTVYSLKEQISKKIREKIEAKVQR
jgi:hypothetical protein